jgi:hypothetical protein
MKKQFILVALLLVFMLTATIAIPPLVTAEAGATFPSVALIQSQSSRPVRTLPGLRNITVWTETSSGPTAFTLGVNGSEFTNRLSGLLSPSNKDFSGPNRTNGTEFYDVFYSNSDGGFNIDGSYITVEAAGAGLSLSEIWLHFAGTSVEPGNTVASFAAFGANADPNSVGNAIDNEISTFTRLGNSIISGEGRRRITIGFASSSVPAGPALFIEDAGVTEGDAGARIAAFNVRLSPPGSATVTVNYSTENFTATSPSDYTASNGTLTFNSGVTVQAINVPVTGDTLYEASEKFFVNLSNPVNAAIGRGQGTGTIANDEPTSIRICSTDVPKNTESQTAAGQSMITVDRDSMVDDLNVSLSFEVSLSGNPLDVYLHIPEAGDRVSLIYDLLVLGGHLGTTCSSSPNCVLDYSAATRIRDASPPYVGSFKPKSSLRSAERRSPKGTWILDFSRIGGGATTLNCWCLEFELPREGCRITPENSTARVFSPHDIRAILTSNGAPVPNNPVTFTVRGEQGELKLQEEVLSNHVGEAHWSHYDFKPGINTIEARTIINGVPSISTAQVTWVADGLSGFNTALLCPVSESLRGISEADATLSTTRNFRDSVLTRTPRGQRYTRLYYEHATEAVQVMMFNPMLILRSREILERYKPLVEAMTRGEQVTLAEGDLDEIDGFLNSFAAKGSAELRESIKGVCRELRDPQMHAEFGIRLTQGPKRELPGRERIQGVNYINYLGSMTMFFGIFGLVIFAASGKRRKFLRRNAKSLLIMLLTVTVMTSNFAPPVCNQSCSLSSHLSQSEQRTDRRPAQIAFEANQGQTDSQVKFISRTDDYDLFLTPTEAVMSLRSRKPKIKNQKPNPLQLPDEERPLNRDVLRMKLIEANSKPNIEGLDPLPAMSNYFTGNDPAKWNRGVPSYARVGYKDVYPGVDILYHSDNGQLEYDFIVASGADPQVIGLAFEGADKIEVDEAGDLVLAMSGNELRQPKPLAYQEVSGIRRIIPCRYAIEDKTVRFEVSEYDKSKPLIIDPVMQYSTYLGGTGDDQGNAITIDANGNAYIIGFTDSLDFPLASAAQNAFGGQQDIFVSKLDASGTRLLYSTYIGGDGQDTGSAITVDAAGNAFVTGYTGSTNFPVANAMQLTRRGPFDSFVAKLDTTGNLIYSTHLGGSVGDFGSSIALDTSGAVYVAGVATSPDFPMVNAAQNAFSGASDVYVAKLTPSGNSLVYSTYLGGSDNDGATSLAVDSSGNVYVTGVTMSSNFRTANPLQAAHRGGVFDAFVAKLNPTGNSLVYSTYIGGSGEDRCFRVAVDSAGNAFVTGDTDSTNFPLVNAVQPSKGGGVDAFITKLNPTGSALVYSTYLGGNSLDGGTAIAVDSAGRAYVTGFTSSTNFPTVAAFQQSFAEGLFDGFVAKLNAAGSALDYSSYIGGSGVDSGFGIVADASGNAYLMGITDSFDYPTVNPLQPSYGGGSSDVFVVKISSGPALDGADIQGKNLLVRGNGFDQGAKILIDGQAQKTKNDNQNPAGLLIGKKAGKKIKKDKTVRLQVRNSDGSLSNELSFRRP